MLVCYVSLSVYHLIAISCCISVYKNEISVSHRIKNKQIVISVPSDDLTFGFAKIIMSE